MKSIATEGKKKSSERTSYEIRRRWDAKNLKRYVVAFRVEDDSEIIDYIETNKKQFGTTQLFREAIQKQIRGK